MYMEDDMQYPVSDVTHLKEAEISELIPDLPKPFMILFERHDISVELFRPDKVDRQTPHDRDEIYIISSGSGTFRREQEYIDFTAGDFLFVAAGEDHRFESFTDDFRTWVIFFGPTN